MTSLFLCLSFIILATGFLVYKALLRSEERRRQTQVFYFESLQSYLFSRLNTVIQLARSDSEEVRKQALILHGVTTSLIGKLGDEFKSEAVKLTEHTESLKAHGQALLDKAHTDTVAPRRTVQR